MVRTIKATTDWQGPKGYKSLCPSNEITHCYPTRQTRDSSRKKVMQEKAGSPVFSCAQRRKGLEDLASKKSIPFHVDARGKGTKFAQALIDNGCISYATVNGDLTRIRIIAPWR